MNNFLSKFSIQSKTNSNDETLLRDRETGQQVLMKEISIQQPEELKKMVETLEGQKDLKNDHILALIDYEVKPNTYNSPTTSYQLITFYQYGAHSLEEQLQSRIAHNSIFQEKQIWSILCSLVEGLAYFQKEHIGHGCVSPSDIFLSEDGSIKIVDPSLTSCSPFVLNEGYYYSPEMIEIFNQENSHYGQSEVDIFKSDMFSLGMCLLHCCLLESCEDCYDYQNCEIIPGVLKEKFNILVDYYSKELLNLLYEMLNFNVGMRPDFIRVEKKLNDFYMGKSKEKKNKKIGPTLKDSQDEPNHQLQEGRVDQQEIDVPEIHDELVTESLRQSFKGFINNKISFENLVSVESINDEDKENKVGNIEYSIVEEKSLSPAGIVKIDLRASEDDGEQVYTDPNLLEMMKNDIAKIMEKRKQCR